MIRLWNQSLGELEHQPEYAAELRSRARIVASDDVQIEVRGVLDGTYGPENSPIDVLGSHLGSMMASLQIVEGAIRAEREGYDAVVIGCFHDPGLREARAAVDIPVVGACESALATASTVGDSIGLVGIGTSNVATVRDLVRRYGHADRVVGVLPIGTSGVSEHEIESSFGFDDRVITMFVETARTLIASGADVLVAADNVLNTALVKRGVAAVDGVPILDGFANVLAFAEMRVRLHRATGIKPGRTVVPALSDDSINRLRRSAATTLLASTSRRSA